MSDTDPANPPPVEFDDLSTSSMQIARAIAAEMRRSAPPPKNGKRASLVLAIVVASLTFGGTAIAYYAETTTREALQAERQTDVDEDLAELQTSVDEIPAIRSDIRNLTTKLGAWRDTTDRRIENIERHRPR